MPSTSSTLLRPNVRMSAGGATGALRLSVASRRRTGVLAGSVVVVTACGALFASAYLKASHQVPVLAVARAVPQGSPVEPRDLAVVHISSSGRLLPVPSTDASRVVGRRAAVALVPGSLLTMGDISGAGSVPRGLAVVGVAVKPSQIPAEGVVSGEAVDVVLTGIPGAPAFAPVAVTPADASAAQPTGTGAVGSDAAGAPAPTFAGTVLAPGALVTHSGAATTSNNGTSDVSLLVPVSVAPVVASASAAGQVALVAVTAP